MIVNRFEQEKMDPYLKKFHLERLRPPAQAFGLRWTDDQIFVTTEGKRKRKIYFNTPLDSDELQEIEKVREMLNKIQLHDKFSDSAILKHYYCAKLNASKAVERIKKSYEWLTDPNISKFTYQTAQELTKGYIYTFGHSLSYKPIIIVRPDIMDFSSGRLYNAIYLIFHIVQRYRMTPYHVEKLQLVIDLNHMKVSQIPYTKMYEMLSQISLVFCENSEKTFVLNATGLGNIWTIVKRFMNEEARNRVIFPKDMGELNQFISVEQREIKYGGTCPNLTEWWPPVATYKEGMSPSKDPVDGPQPVEPPEPVNNEQSFYSVVNNPTYFGIIQAQQPNAKCNCKCALF